MNSVLHLSGFQSRGFISRLLFYLLRFHISSSTAVHVINKPSAAVFYFLSCQFCFFPFCVETEGIATVYACAKMFFYFYTFKQIYEIDFVALISLYRALFVSLLPDFRRFFFEVIVFIRTAHSSHATSSK